MIDITVGFPNTPRQDKQEIRIRPIAVAVCLSIIFLMGQQFSAVSRPKVPPRAFLEFGEAERCLSKKEKNLTTSQVSTLSTQMSTQVPISMPTQVQLKPKPKLKSKRTLHIIQGLNGNGAPFIAEWEVCLKSLLMNAPLDAPMHIHYVADFAATEAIKKIVEDKAKLNDTLWRNPITITVYSIPPEINELYIEFVKEKIRGHAMNARVTLGNYYHILAYNVIVDHYYNRTTSTTVSINNGTESRTVNIRMPQTQRNISMNSDPPICAISMDVDVAILANMNPLLQQIDSKYLMQVAMAKGLNGGFLMLNLSQLDEFWDLLEKIPKLNRGNDQYLFDRVQSSYPNRVGRLSLPWDVHLAHGWRSHPHDLLEDQPGGVDMLHFAAKRPGAVSYFNENKDMGMDFMCHREEACRGNETRLEQFRSSWGLVEYFVRIPWSWVVHQYGENKLPMKDGSNDSEDDTEEGSNGFPLRLEYVNV